MKTIYCVTRFAPIDSDEPIKSFSLTATEFATMLETMSDIYKFEIASALPVVEADTMWLGVSMTRRAEDDEI